MALPSALPDALRGSLTTVGALVPRVDQCLVVDDALGSIFPFGGLVRGHVIGFGGDAAVSLALASVAKTIAQGSWMAVVGFPELGVEAADQLGVPLGRVVRVERGRSPLEWADRVAACADGFDVVMVDMVPPAGLLRRVRQRLHARGSVLMVVDTPHSVGRGGLTVSGVGREGQRDHGHDHGCDTYLTTTNSRWVGIGSGHGALLARMVTVTVAGRRVPRRTGGDGAVEHRLWLPTHTGEIEVVADGSTDDHRLVS